MSCDETLCGDTSGGSMLQSCHRPRAGLREQALCSASPSEHTTSPASGSAPSEFACVLCQDNGHLCKEWRSAKLHSQCWNAVRCYLRLCTTVMSKDVEKCLFANDLAAWRARVLPLVTETSQRSSSARLSVRKEIVEEEHFDDSAEIQDTLQLCKVRYKAYMGMWEGMSPSEASSEFETELEAATSDHEDYKGRPTVLVHDNSKSRKATVHRSSKKQRTSVDLDGERRVDRDSERHRAAASGGDRERSRGRDRRRSAGAAALPALPMESAMAPFVRMEQGTKSPSAKVLAPNPLTAAALAIHSSGLTGSCDGGLRFSNKFASETGCARPGKQVTPVKSDKAPVVKFMERKKQLREDCEAMLEQASGKTSISSRIKSSLARLTPSQMSELEDNHDEMLENIGEVVDKLAKLQGELGHVKASDIDGKALKLKELKEHLDIKQAVAEEFFEGVKFVQGEVSSAKRQADSHARYMRSKLSNRLVLGGFGKEYTKMMTGRLLHKMNDQQNFVDTDPADFRPGFIATWGESATMVKEFVATCTAQHAIIETKRANITKTMEDPKNDKWTGCSGRVDMQVDCSTWGIDASPADHQGTCPWIVCMKKHCWRWGPNTWTMPGMGCFVKPLSVGVVLQLFKVATFLEHGVIALDDLPSFLETATGKSCMVDDSWLLLDLRDGKTIAWVPFGYVISPVFVPMEDQAVEASMGHVLSWCIFDPALAKQVSVRSWASVSAWNSSHFEKMGSHTMWASRKTAFKELCDGM